MSAKNAARIAIGMSVLAATATGIAPMAAQARQDACTYNVTRSYAPESSSWYYVESGTIDTRHSSASVTHTHTWTSTHTMTGSVSAELGIKADLAALEVNGKLGVSVSASASVTRGHSTSITVPAGHLVTYRTGIMERIYSVTETITYASCATKTVGGSAVLADLTTITSG